MNLYRNLTRNSRNINLDNEKAPVYGWNYHISIRVNISRA